MRASTESFHHHDPRTRRCPLFLWIVCAFQIVCGDASAKEKQVETGIVLASIAGNQIRPLECVDPACRAAVVIFVTTDCPVANRSAPEIERVRAEFEPRGMKMTLVHVVPELSDEEAAKHAAEYALKAPVVIDRKHQLVAALDAKVTPEAFVIDRDGRVRYRGRIDDQFADYGARRKEASVRDLRDAVSAVLEGREVKMPVTEAIGCFIPEIER